MNETNSTFIQTIFKGILQKKALIGEKMRTVSVIAGFFISFVFLSLTALDLIDSDLWFHLNQGRELFATGAIPDTSFFSYIEPERYWVNYSWLFQAIIYQIFMNTGCVGLIVLRSFLYVLIGVMLYFLFSKKSQYNIFIAAITVLFFIAIAERSMVIRPHVLTYISIVATIYILEKRKFFWLLPVIFLLEANIHGIAYPFLIFVLASYVADYYVDFRQKSESAISKKELYCVFLAPLFLLFSPHGYHLFPLPFENAASFVHYYIMEMRPLEFSQISVFSFSSLPAALNSIRILLILFGVVLFLYYLCRRTLKISQGMLACGGMYLLLQSDRFQFECLFFLLPVYVLFLSNRKTSQTSVSLFVSSALFLVVPSLVFGSYWSNSSHYPLSVRSVPSVGGEFIYQLPEKQKVLMPPEKAGYLAWALFPKHKIYLDLELALFNDVDAFESMQAFKNPVVMEHHINRYHPSVLYLPFATSISADFTAALQNYRPVFFDDFGVIYLHRDVPSKFPELSFLKTIAALQVDKTAFTETEKNKLIEQLEGVADFSAQGFRANSLLGNAYFAFDRPEKMLVAAEKLIRWFPEQSAGFVFKAQALFLLHQPEKSVQYFQQALTKQGIVDRALLGKNYYVALTSLKRFDEAYRVLQESYNPYSKKTPPDMLYEFAIGAVNAGKYEEARKFIDIALLSLPDQDTGRRNELFRLKKELRAFFSKQEM